MRERSRRGSARWAVPYRPQHPQVDVLIPTSGRTAELSVTLAGLAAQDDPPFRVIVSDQAAEPVESIASVGAMARVRRDTLLDAARDAKAPDDVIAALERLPDQEYEKPTDVSHALSQE